MLPTFGVIKAYESKKYFGHMFSVFLLGGVHHLLLLAKVLLLGFISSAFSSNVGGCIKPSET